MKKLILTVCNGNIHRSVIATLCIDKAITDRCLGDQYEVLSRGLQGSCGTPTPLHRHLKEYSVEWALTQPLLKEMGVTISDDQVSTPIDGEVVCRASVILAMDTRTLFSLPNSLINQFPESGFKMRMFSEIGGSFADIPDCFGKTDSELFRKTVQSIHIIAQSSLGTLLRLADELGKMRQS